MQIQKDGLVAALQNYLAQVNQDGWQVQFDATGYVDDIMVVRAALRWLLEDEADLTVVGEAGDGWEALQRAAELAPEVVILDIELPGLDGYTVVRRLKALPKPPAVVFLTVHSDVVWRQRAIEAEGDGFAEKGKGWLTLID